MPGDLGQEGDSAGSQRNQAAGNRANAVVGIVLREQHGFTPHIK